MLIVAKSMHGQLQQGQRRFLGSVGTSGMSSNEKISPCGVALLARLWRKRRAGLPVAALEHLAGLSRSLCPLCGQPLHMQCIAFGSDLASTHNRCPTGLL
jgi:hypothetical protein